MRRNGREAPTPAVRPTTASRLESTQSGRSASRAMASGAIASQPTFGAAQTSDRLGWKGGISDLPGLTATL
jgi:hypothetical protein